MRVGTCTIHKLFFCDEGYVLKVKWMKNKKNNMVLPKNERKNCITTFYMQLHHSLSLNIACLSSRRIFRICFLIYIELFIYSI